MSARWWMPRAVPWETAFPLPQDTAHLLVQQELVCENAGLAMERLLAYNDGRQGPEMVRELADRTALALDFSGQAELIEAWRARWQATADAMGAATFHATPEWRVIVGIGANKLLEVGIRLQHVYGVPIVPATALKGITRLYAERVVDAPAARVVQLFGEAEIAARRGDLVFLDAVPTAPPRLERDIANPLFGAYYGGKENAPPADYMTPRPIFFVAVGQGSHYAFGVASLSRDAQAVADGVGWLKAALQDLGVGAKTAAGYGYWLVEEDG
jgi:CRISPR-associated protein Cmr6